MRSIGLIVGATLLALVTAPAATALPVFGPLQGPSRISAIEWRIPREPRRAERREEAALRWLLRDDLRYERRRWSPHRWRHHRRHRHWRHHRRFLFFRF